MSGKQLISTSDIAIDVAVTLAYPVTAVVQVCKCGLGEFHRIEYNGDPSAGVLFVNAPNGSHFMDNANAKLYVKLGAVGSGIGGVITHVT